MDAWIRIFKALLLKKKSCLQNELKLQEAPLNTRVGHFQRQKRDIRINELEKENSIKDSKISELQANLGGLTTLSFDMTQHLIQKFSDEFQPLSTEGEKITASSSGPGNPTS
ncbi:unnamed protein product [Lactuca saligna]|uniref:Uncharacterized protein n=1 Tax=Lactuca saligna TaxID=75948 RepID=A0AA35ZQI3_LACSI|nr:unnamed protein product [Lactuca saligna]